MKTTPRCLTAAFALAAAAVASAQEGGAAPAAQPAPAVAALIPAPPPPAERPRSLGVGFALESAKGGSILVPIDFGRLRFEPSLGLTAGRTALPGLPSSGNVSLSLGAGLLYLLQTGPQSAVYAGGRLGFSFARTNFGANYDYAFGEQLSAVVGGEYFPAPFVSIGGEARAGFTGSHPHARYAADTYEVSTSTQLLVRFYAR